MNDVLSPDFYARDAATVARELVGTYLVHETISGKKIGKVVETEAYLADDPASHSFKGKTARNEAMFGPPGTVYIYLIYGIHYCFNVVTGEEGSGEAVLIRALEPIEGISAPTNGPAKLVSALGIVPSYNHLRLNGPPLYICQAGEPESIIVSPRIGIRKAAERPLRFSSAGNPWVSRTPKSANEDNLQF